LEEINEADLSEEGTLTNRKNLDKIKQQIESARDKGNPSPSLSIQKTKNTAIYEPNSADNRIFPTAYTEPSNDAGSTYGDEPQRFISFADEN